MGKNNAESRAAHESLQRNGKSLIASGHHGGDQLLRSSAYFWKPVAAIDDIDESKALSESLWNERLGEHVALMRCSWLMLQMDLPFSVVWRLGDGLVQRSDGDFLSSREMPQGWRVTFAGCSDACLVVFMDYGFDRPSKKSLQKQLQENELPLR